jgi:hypothetical protein
MKAWMADSWQQQILEAAERVVRSKDELRKANDELRNAEEQFYRLTGAPPKADAEAPPSVTASNGARMVEGSLAHRIVQALERDPTHKFAVEEIARVIGAHKPQSMRSTLVRLTDAHRINRAGRGRYRAKETTTA